MAEHDFIPGQRWISDTEPELGLGMVTGTTGRTLTLRFTAAAESRTYAADNAPLTRVRFQVGDTIESDQGWDLTVESVAQRGGLLTYAGTCSGTGKSGQAARLGEQSISAFMQFNRPQARLFAGQPDGNIWFELRKATLLQQQSLKQSDLIGLGGARTELLPHQLYIAHEASRRLAPRILLADEVGLGKTIEACLILHAQLLTERAHRALIVVPPPLLHQWLVELLRRFNLNFSLFDEPRCAEIEASINGENPFLTEQLVLCGLDLFTGSPQRLTQALAGEWDMLIVDEAHHLVWHEANPSPAYQAIESLAGRIPGVLLLTATPEQLGRDGHFARLRLLDPDRFPSLAQFRQEQAHYRSIADAAAGLIADTPLSVADAARLLETLGEAQAAPLLAEIREPDGTPARQRQARDRLTELLLDRHGTGRGMFRNTRERIKGFAPRIFHAYPLDLPARYRSAEQAAAAPSRQLQPEHGLRGKSGAEWWRHDPRVDWLITLLKRYRGEKLLLICAHAGTAMDLEQALRIREGMHAALFHEGMSIIERDRAAAWFADHEQGCQILLCSEIGSEGRNFQFAHHLILFDLPENPDLLEQRIGRLDRIGQKRQIELHAPYFRDSAQEVLLRWYHEGLNAFVHTCQAGQQLLEQLGPALHQAYATHPDNPADLERLLTRTRQLHAQIGAALKNGRDHLLELNSCREKDADRLVQQLALIDRTSALGDYMDQLFAAYGVEAEPHSSESLVIRPGQHMLTEHFPHLPQEGTTLTYDRGTALTHEQWLFLTWEHPMVHDAMDMLLESGRGNCAAMGIRHPAVPSGTLALEMLFVLECPAPGVLQAARFLPPTLLRTVVDQRLAERGDAVADTGLESALHTLPKPVIHKIVTPLRKPIQAMITQGEQNMAGQARQRLRQAETMMNDYYAEEIDRLDALHRVNPYIRQADIDLLRAHQSELNSHLAASRVRLDAIRLLIGL
ncbi:RNA polymerase-associated protein RapA [Sedimenticola hydrogenitrophicus]|uniref:RNA polymerase-associated protein RapA n=1 Tax=Sedimenticola hydrogenitrophicus TaxID=2967975 RepID=UPI0023AF47D4|nr:RNA polymerase-associated protein RapA [Sedimenticola hydrogenitrophicus]